MLFRLGMTAVLVAVLYAGELSAQQTAVAKAWDLLGQGKRAEAADLLRLATRNHPADAEARLLLGSLLVEAGDLGEALSQLREAVRLQPKSAMAHNALGEALSDAGHLTGARQSFQKAVQFDPKFAQAWENLGLVLLRAEEHAEAGRHLDRAIGLLGRTEAVAYTRYLRAKVHTALGEAKQAEAELRRALAIRPEFPEGWSDLGQALEGLGDDNGALSAYQRAVQIDPYAAVALTRLGSLLLDSGKTEQAVPHLERAAKLDPANQTTLNSLQLALRETGNEARADQVKSQLAQIFRKRDQESQNALAAVQMNNEGAELEKKGDIAAAAERYGAASKLNPGHAGIRANYAVALLRLGRWELGLEELRTAVRLDPSNEKFKKALDDALAQAPASVRGAK